ncbi:hypothetical protein [Profundibacterium mesophilum]|uniref:Uncharacterized protein n=1 Tax=Profundibacterium mesophilum KAUST100406-0324 TaxID=1037889 RepID=A0A921NSM4_9RHOB|nr:hypothetical protein [Profundibacterium mesophilum]KAF0674695.1 hypothetical protein PMES_03078 [Profundibacterium mesophilum KAUST100406-0324]
MPADLRAAMAGIRLPPDAAGGHLGELFAAAGAGLLGASLAALLLSMLARHAPRRRRAGGPVTTEARIAALGGLEENARRRALLLLMPHAERAQWATRLYRPGSTPRIHELEEALRGSGGPGRVHDAGTGA